MACSPPRLVATLLCLAVAALPPGRTRALPHHLPHLPPPQQHGDRGPPPFSGVPPVHAALNASNGNLSLSFGGLETCGQPVVYGGRFAGAVVPTFQDYQRFNASYDAAASTITLEYVWGTLSWAWDLSRLGSDHEIAAALSVTNHWNSTLEQLDVWLAREHDAAACAWNPPTAPRGGVNLEYCPWSASMPCQGGGRTSPAAVLADWRDAAVALSLADATGNVSAANLTVGWEQTYGHHVFVRPADVPVGGTRAFRFVMRFGAGSGWSNTTASVNAVVNAMLGPALASFRQRYPMRLEWPDRRPIGTIFLSSGGASAACETLSPADCPNPRGYLSGQQINVTSVAGRSDFADKMVAFYNESVQRALAAPAYSRPQAIITWDLSGSEWSWITYTGDPSMVHTLAPEMDAVADRCLALIADAGLRVGLTLRPQQITRDAAWHPGLSPKARPQEWFQRELLRPDNTTDDDAILALLTRKTRYARERWNATVFYIDTIGGRNGCYNMDIFMRLAEAFPDTLFIPEGLCGTPELTHTSTLDNNRGDVQRTSAAVNATWPAAFKVNLMQGNAPSAITHDTVLPYAEAVCRGDVLLEFMWWPDARNTVAQAAYAMVHNGTVSC